MKLIFILKIVYEGNNIFLINDSLKVNYNFLIKSSNYLMFKNNLKNFIRKLKILKISNNIDTSLMNKVIFTTRFRPIYTKYGRTFYSKELYSKFLKELKDE